MKKKNTKLNHKNFTKKARAKGSSKKRNANEAKKRLMRELDAIGVKYNKAKIFDKTDFGMPKAKKDLQNKKKSDIITEGVFSGTQSGFGFVKVEGMERDIFIPEDNTGAAIDGDTVRVCYHTYLDRFKNERTEGYIERVLIEERKSVLGILERNYTYRRKNGGAYKVIPSDSRVNLEILIDAIGDMKIGELVEVSIKRGIDAYSHRYEIIKSFGPADSKDANYEAILSECGITTDFLPEALAEADEVAKEKISLEGRQDRREDIIFTIDGADAKDLDDAISLKRLPGGKWQLGVHIADVSHYVREKSALDEAVMQRGTSVYFTDKVVPMLPTALSNGACSLHPGEPKYTLSAIITLSDDGDILKTVVEKSVIESRIKGVYSEINDLFENKEKSEFYKKYQKLYPTLLKMHELYLVLRKRSLERGSPELDCPEAKILLDENGEVTDIIRRERGDSERLIEQFMLIANEGIARLMHEKGYPCVYRIHENPDPKKLDEFLSFIENVGISTASIDRDNVSSLDYQKLLEAADEKGLIGVVSNPMLRTMAKAKYSETLKPHFGLGLKKYCHFTSPIRRLADLATHRMIHRVLLEGEHPNKFGAYSRRAANAASETELKALNAERRIEALYKTIYMSKHLGEEFMATVSSVTAFGMFCTLDNTCEGLVPLSEMGFGASFYEKTLTISTKRATYRLGSSVRVRLEEADIIRGKLRFSVVNQ